MAKKRRDPDYTLNIFPFDDEETKRRVIVFLVQTTKIFVSFRYEILLEEHLAARVITLRILGLYVPEILLPQTGPARGRRDFTGLRGAYTLHVVKQDGSVNDFHVDISDPVVTIKRKPTDAFILVAGEPADLG
jgi:hypothetical protein